MEDKTVRKLIRIASHYSFFRILSRISFRENTNYFSLTGHEFDEDSSRIINKEFEFLTGLWLDNVDLRLPNWKNNEDDRYEQEVYRLLAIYQIDKITRVVPL